MFSQEQLEIIRDAARKVKNQGELAVYNKVRQNSIWWILDETQQLHNIKLLAIVKYCAEECERQHSGEMSVYDMVNAWEYTAGLDPIYGLLDTGKHILDVHYIEVIGTYVEPIDNRDGFRTIPIGVTDGMGGWIEKANWERVPELLTLLLESYYEGNLSPAKDEIGFCQCSCGCGCDGSLGFELDEKGFCADCNKGNHEVPPEGIYGWNPISQSAEDQFYYEFENIHPFVDGNGRTGKILYNYLRGTLNEPKMPPNFWGISNP